VRSYGLAIYHSPGYRLNDKAQAATDKLARGAAKAKKKAPQQTNTLFNYAVASKVCCNCMELRVSRA